MFSDVFKEYFKMLLTGKQKFQKRIWNGHPSNPRMYANVLSSTLWDVFLINFFSCVFELLVQFSCLKVCLIVAQDSVLNALCFSLI